MDLQSELNEQRTKRLAAENNIRNLEEQMWKLKGEPEQIQQINKIEIENAREQLRVTEAAAARLLNELQTLPIRLAASESASMPPMSVTATFNRVSRIERDRKSFDDRFINLIKEGNCEKVISIIKNYRSKKLVDSNGTHLLHLLVKYNNIDVIEFCIESKYELDVEDSSGITPMISAILHERFVAARTLHNAIFKALVDRKIQPDKKVCYTFCSFLPKINKKEIRTRLLNNIVAKLKENELTSKQIGKVLARLQYKLSYVVRLYDSEMTEAFLQLKPFDGQSDFHLLKDIIEKFDWPHVKVLIRDHSNQKGSLMYQFIRILMKDLSEYNKSEAGRDFLKKVFTSEIFNEHDVKHFEQCLGCASKNNVIVFLQFGFHTVAKAMCGRDISGAFFSNPNLGPDFLLNNWKIDVDKRYYNENTALHIASMSSLPENVDLLLNKGADPNASNNHQYTALGIILKSANRQDTDKKCIELLLMSGANFPIFDYDSKYGIYFQKPNKFMQRDEGFTKLLAAHIAIQKVLGLPIEQTLKTYISSRNENLRTFFDACVELIKEFQIFTIQDTRKYKKTAITMFTLLTERPEKIVHLLTEEDLKMIDELVMQNADSWPSQYYDVLKKRVKDIVKINYLKHRAAIYTSLFSGIQDPRHLVVQKIVQYLSFKDLLIFD